MCGLCPDVIGSCSEIECGACEPLGPNGERRRWYMRHFTLGEVPCRHVREGHREACPIHTGGDCDFEDECDL